MSSSIRHSEVSEVARAQIQRTESGWRACARTMYMVTYTSMYMGMYNVHDARAVEGRNGRKIDSKVPTSKYLDALKASKAFSTNNLAKQGHNLAFLSHNLAVTSPTKPMKTLVFSHKARLARLKVDIPRVRENYVHPHVHVHSLYRSGLEITSLDLANLASGFLSVRARLFCSYPSHDVAPRCEFFNTSPTKSYVAHNATVGQPCPSVEECQFGTHYFGAAPCYGSFTALKPFLGGVGKIAVLASVCFVRPLFLNTLQRIDL